MAQLDGSLCAGRHLRSFAGGCAYPPKTNTVCLPVIIWWIIIMVLYGLVSFENIIPRKKMKKYKVDPPPPSSCVGKMTECVLVCWHSLIIFILWPEVKKARKSHPNNIRPARCFSRGWSAVHWSFCFLPDRPPATACGTSKLHFRTSSQKLPPLNLRERGWCLGILGQKWEYMDLASNSVWSI